MFSERSADRVARLRMPLPALGALTACAHVQWDATSSDPAALFSLAVPTLANALQLRALAEPGGAVHAALVVRGHHAPFRAAFRADGRWHHVCVTWEQLGGRWSLFADGRRRSGAFPIWMPFVCFSCLIAPGRTYSTSLSCSLF